MIKLGALWKNKSKDGKKYLSGKLEASVLVFPNNHKKEDKHPDFLFYLPEPKQKNNGGDDDDDWGMDETSSEQDDDDHDAF